MPTIGFTFGLFISEFESQFGWPRTQISLAMSIVAVVTFLGSIPAGYLADRMGARSLAAGSMLLYGGSLLILPTRVETLNSLYLFYLAITVLGLGTLPVVLLKPVVSSFTKQRGLAVGLSMAGVGLGAFLLPQLAGYFISSIDWRAGYAAIGCAALIASIVIWMLLPATARLQPLATPDPDASQEGYTLLEALPTWRFWVLSAISVLCIFGIGGVTTHLAPLVRDSGASASEAAGLASLVGAGSIAGRVLTGVLLDRIRAPGVGSVLIGMGALGVAALALGGPATAAPTAVMVGFALGAEIDLMAYFVSRYFGLRAHGAIFGWNYAMVALGGALAPVTVSLMRDSFGRYSGALWVLVGALLIAAALCSALGPYRYRLHGEARESA